MPPTSGFYAWLSGWLDWLRSLFFKREMELSLIGLNKGGKSTLVHVLTTGQFQEDSIPTVGTRADPALQPLHPVGCHPGILPNGMQDEKSRLSRVIPPRDAVG